MTFPRWLAFLSAIVGSMVISLGMVLQKKGVAWFRWPGPKDAQYRRLRTLWFLGFGLNNLLSVFYFFALKAMSSAEVGATMGLNILFSAAFSAVLLKEPLSKRVITGSGAMVAFIVLANLSAPPYVPAVEPSLALISAFFAAPYALVGLAVGARRFLGLQGDAYAMAFAAAAGALEGFIIVLIKAMQATHGNDILRYAATPYLYMYLASSASLIAFMQVAYAHGRMTKAGPVLWGMQIVYPVVIAYAAFGAALVPAQALAFTGILACVVVIQSKRY